MKVKELSIAAVRILALWTLLQCIVLFEQIPIYFFNPSYSSDSYTKFIAFVNMFNAALYLLIGFTMLARTERVAGYLTRGIEEEESLNVQASELAILGFGLIGLLVCIDGMEKVLHQVITYYLEPEIKMSVEIVQRKFNNAVFITGMMKICMGIVLLVSPEGIVRALKWSREAGKERQGKA